MNFFIKTNSFYDKEALSSDAFSAFSKIGEAKKEREENNTDVVNSTRHLYQHVIPEFAQHLDSIETKKMSLHSLASSVHQAGINFRMLGVIRNLTTKPHNRTLLFTEMVSRMIKNEIRMLFRKVQKEKKGHGNIFCFFTFGFTRFSQNKHTIRSSTQLS